MSDLLSKAQRILSVAPSRWQTLMENVPHDLLTRSPAPGEWSALECLQHVIDTERDVFPARVRAFLAGQNFPAFNPAAHDHKADSTVDPQALANSFSAIRKSTLELLATLTPKDLDRTAIHGELGKVTLGEMLNEWIGHDLMHTVQAERAILQPFIIDSGPWRKYFADHDTTLKQHAK